MAGKGASEWISRQIAMFGRYPKKRPSGLKVDDNGSFGLKELMWSWGKKEGVTEEQVIGAVKTHMFHEGGSGALRFSIDEREDGSISIRVLPKRGQNQRACATPSRSQWQNQGNQANRWGGGWKGAKPPVPPPPKLTPGPGPRGSVGLAPGPDDEQQPSSLQERLDMPLDAVIIGKKEKGGSKGGGSKGAAEHSGSASSAMSRQDKLSSSLDDVIRSEDVEMTDAQADSKQASSPDSGGRRGWGRRSGKSGGSSWDNWGDWGSSNRRGSGRAGRKSYGRQGGGGGNWREEGDDSNRGRANSPAASSSSGSRSRSASWRRERRARRVRGREDSEQQAPTVSKDVPCKPPGEHWRRYVDYRDNGADVMWWHYDGPLGQWFANADGQDVKPYIPDNEDQ